MREESSDVFQKRAGIYELAVYGCYLLGFPINRYRRLSVDALAPRPGDTIIEIGCGTGMNFPLLQPRVQKHERVFPEIYYGGARCLNSNKVRTPGMIRLQVNDQ